MNDEKSMSMLSDQLNELVAKARKGEQDATAALYQRTYNKVYYTVKSMIKEEQDVLDILQDTYIKAFTHLDYFKEDTKFLPWVRQIAANTARDFLKKKRPTLFTDLNTNEEQDTPIEEQFVDEHSEYIPDEAIDQAEGKRLIREIIESLPEDQRAVIGMYYYQEMPVKAIAAALEASESAVKSRLLYGRKKIEAKVQDLEKRGTKLYGLAPIPFLLWLMRGQEAHAAELPNVQILQKVVSAAAEHVSADAGTAAGSIEEKAGAATSTAATNGAAAGGLGAIKIGLIALAAVVVVGAGVFGISKLVQTPEEPPAAPVETQESVEEPPADTQQQTPETEEPEVENAMDKALEQYRIIINQADSYTYSQQSVEPTGNYRYALVMMRPDDPVPTLLLSQEGMDYTYRVRVFQYAPDTQTVIQPEDVLEEYGGSSWYHSGLSMESDGNGIQWTGVSGGTGDTEIIRITMNGQELQQEKQWSGRMDAIPSELDSIEIIWHGITEIEALDSWTPEANTPPESSSEATPPVETDTETTIPEDGDRIVFTGTIDTFSYDQVVDLQGCPDPNAQWTDPNQTYRLIVLDTPQTMKLQGVDGPRNGEVRLISVSFAEGLEQHDGQHLTFSIDPEATYWPSDTSLPIGQPSTTDVHVLG